MILSSPPLNSPETRLLIPIPRVRRPPHTPAQSSAAIHLNPSRIPPTLLSPVRLSSSRRRAHHLPLAMEPTGDSSPSAPEEAAPNTAPNTSDDPELASRPMEASTRGADVLGGSEEGGEERKIVLPEELSKNVVFLECKSSTEGGSCDVYLVGTAHVSQESCKQVQAIISYLKPQVVFLELCSSRVGILTAQSIEVPTVREMIDMWKKNKMNPFGILYSWFLAKVAHKLEVLPGSEFRVAFDEAMSYGAKVILGDRHVHITLRRTWGKMTPWYRAKFIYYILFQAFSLPDPEDLNKMLREMDDVDMITLVVQEMSKQFPTLMETLLHERDLYMSSTLLEVARQHSSVVAVVGKGHLSGIKRNWKQPIEVEDLMKIPTGSVGISRTKIFVSLAVTGVAIASAIYLVGKK